jgi:parvulin-like peptidyl-prolyl isomerase
MRTTSQLLLIVGFLLVSHERTFVAQEVAPTASTGLDVVVRVNGDPITRAEYDRMLANPLTRRELQQELGGDNPDQKKLDRLAKRKLIHRRLLLQEAARRSLAVTEAELDKAVMAMRLRFEDLKNFGVWMKQQGLDERTVFDAVREDMLADRVMVALAKGLGVSEREVQRHYGEHKEDLTIEEVRLHIIVVKDKKSAEEILNAALKDRRDFGVLARERSVGLRAAKGGDTGWVRSAKLWPPLKAIVDTLKPREATGPLQRGEEFLLVRLHERRRVRPQTLDEARAEVKARLLAAKRQETIKAWLNEQEKKSKIEVLHLSGESQRGI